MNTYREKSPHLLVVGDLMLDHYLWGKSDRVSPEAPVVVVDVAKETTNLGGAGNVVYNLLALGARVSVASVIGDDENGQTMRSMLDGCGVDTTSIIAQHGRKTSRKSRIMALHQQVIRYDSESKDDISQESEDALLKALIPALKTIDGVLLSDYKKGVLTPSLTQAIIKEARAQGKFVLVDPKGSDYSKYYGATLVTPNKKEAIAATGIEIVDDASLQKAGFWLKENVGLDQAIITLSEDGMAIFGDKGATSWQKIPTRAKEVYDVTGAGDTVLAGLAFALSCGDDVVGAATFANKAAAVVVGKIGSATATLDEVDAYEHTIGKGDSATKIKSHTQLSSIVKAAKLQGRKVVFTNGCFDIIHSGHVKYLQQAASLGDILIVAVNSDSSVRGLKGEGRPVVGEDDRAFVLSGLEAVSYVTIFDAPTPHELISLLVPDILVKGGDYVANEIVGYDVVTQNGGEVVVGSFVDGKSTTKIIQKITG